MSRRLRPLRSNRACRKGIYGTYTKGEMHVRPKATTGNQNIPRRFCTSYGTSKNHIYIKTCFINSTIIFYQFGSILITQTHILYSEFRTHQEEAIFQPLLADNFDDTELEAMNKTVTEQHAIYKEKIKSEKSLKAVKRKLSDEVFDAEDDFGLDSALRFKKSYCQEVNERLNKKVNEKEDSELLPSSDLTFQEILTADKTKAAKLSRYGETLSW